MSGVARHAPAAALRRRGGRVALAAAAALAVAIALAAPGFASPANLSNLLVQNAALLAAALGQSLVVLAGGLDISAGSVVSLTTVVLSLDAPAWVTLPVAAAMWILVGVVNGLGVAWARVHPIIMTLSSMTILQGVALALRPSPGGAVPPALVDIANLEIAGLPLPLFWGAGLVAITAYVLYATRFGLHLYAVGAAPANARFAGVPTASVLVAAYVASALGAGIAGLHVAGRIGSGDALVGQSFSVDAITAVALGGTLLSGGAGSVGGTVAGVAILALVANGMNFLGVPVFYQYVLKGGLLIAAVCLFRRSEPGL